MKDYIARSMTYSQYLQLIDELLAEGKATGPNRSEAMVAFSKLNRQRMTRLAKTIALNADLSTAARNVNRLMIWLIITEGWCGDAAQNIPVIEKIAAESDNIETRYILRDEYPELMDRFLSNGARSIPKLIALDAASLEVLGTWGARPAPAQKLFQALRQQGIAKPLIMENLQRWYNDDRRSITIQNEFSELIEQWENNHTTAAAG